MLFQFDIPNSILYEDDYILAIHKPHGLMVEPDRNGHPNLLQYVQRYIKQSIYPDTNVYAQHLHRLDRVTSGIVLFTKKKDVLKNLSEQFAQRKVKKYYKALTTNAPENKEGILENWLRKEKKKSVVVEERAIGAEKAILKYNLTSLPENRFSWDIELHTGKFHQIRIQLAQIGCPIIGDKLYGSKENYKKDAIALHAYKLIFLHPITNKDVCVENE